MTQTAAQRTCKHVEAGQVCPFEAEHQLHDEREAKFEWEQGTRLYNLNDDRETAKAEAEYGLYCQICQHGNGCEHGVSLARW